MRTVKQGKKSSRRPILKHRTSLKVTAITVVLVAIAALAYFRVYPYTSEAKTTKQLQDTQTQLLQQRKQLEDQILHNKNLDEKTKKQIEELNKQLEEKDKQLQAKAARKVYAATAPQSSGPCNTGNPYKDYIYNHESSCRTGAVNSIGCRGIGQACPGSKLPCGEDFACQDAFFSDYAERRYGGWYNAYVFWVNNHWW